MLYIGGKGERTDLHWILLADDVAFQKANGIWPVNAQSNIKFIVSAAHHVRRQSTLSDNEVNHELSTFHLQVSVMSHRYDCL